MVSEAPTCRAVLNQATARWPNRNKSSDGILSSDAHKIQNPTSDHDHGNAVDLTHDPANGCDAHRWVRWLAAQEFPEIKYLISNNEIWSMVRRSEGWRPYTGSNPHTKHAHMSINSTHRDSRREWFPAVRTVEETMAKLDAEDLGNIKKIVDAETNDIYWRILGVPNTTPTDARPTLKEVLARLPKP